MSARSLTAEQDAEIVHRYQAGEIIPDLAKAFGVSTMPIRRALQRANVTTRREVVRDRLTPELRAEIASACASGGTIREVAEKYGIGKTTVDEIANEHNVALQVGRPSTK